LRTLCLLGQIVEAKNVLSALAAALAIWLLVSRAVSEYYGYEFQNLILRVFAKCPGLPYGSNSGGPDYIDISIDVGLTVVAAVFIALTIRDIRRKRRLGNSSEDGENSENEDKEGDDL
jgi:hypothetical protein